MINIKNGFAYLMLLAFLVLWGWVAPLGPANSAEDPLAPSATFAAGGMMWDSEKYQLAVDIWEELAAKGHKNAAWTLFGMYLSDGPLGPANGKKAINALTPIAMNGVADAREAIGDVYYYGRAIKQDYALAAIWYKRYVKVERDPDILTRYAILMATGKGTKQNKLKAFKMLYEAAQEKGYTPAYLVGKQVFQVMDPVDQFLATSFIHERTAKARSLKHSK